MRGANVYNVENHPCALAYRRENKVIVVGIGQNGNNMSRELLFSSSARRIHLQFEFRAAEVSGNDGRDPQRHWKYVAATGHFGDLGHFLLHTGRGCCVVVTKIARSKA
tara:strand:+ start:1002 stop:1325 length:324 start_codon:yes stop_codon:yes gene_type:complete